MPLVRVVLGSREKYWAEVRPTGKGALRALICITPNLLTEWDLT